MGIDYSPMIVVGLEEEQFISKVLRGGQRKLYKKDPEAYVETRLPGFSRNHQSEYSGESLCYVGIVVHRGESSRHGGDASVEADLTDKLLEARERFKTITGRDVKPTTFSYTHVW